MLRRVGPSTYSWEHAIKTYDSPRAFRDALTQRAKQIAPRGNPSPVLRGFYFQRLLARLFQADPDGWLLKGGQALLVRFPADARLSKDIDLQRVTTAAAAGREEAHAALLKAAAVDLGDFLSYVPGKTSDHGAETEGIDQTFTVYLGTTRVDTVHVDLVIRRNITAVPETVPLEPRPLLDWPLDWPMIKLYPLVDHVADKICAIHEWRGTKPPSRFRDLADVLLIGQRETLDAAACHHALHTEAALRRACGWPELRLPETFELPHASWVSGYRTAVADVPGLDSCATWDAAFPQASAFITPLLGPAFTGTWDPRLRVWTTS
ncbi:nucleotidyl transferase AbiEii/AbiGii toxin family protein [Embleya sp. NPDC020630]|uniref:nucleotidyl transferase AbiEii/AbiGii toxin family protein n=1 Tax=Embleya sp. NPDC020630 TaxID=3363979 RepID=UPI0037ABE302